jgi:hypothetical protein
LRHPPSDKLRDPVQLDKHRRPWQLWRPCLTLAKVKEATQVRLVGHLAHLQDKRQREPTTDMGNPVHLAVFTYFNKGFAGHYASGTFVINTSTNISGTPLPHLPPDGCKTINLVSAPYTSVFR